MFGKRKKEKGENDILRILATKPASVNIAMLISDAKKVINKYLLAVYGQKIEQLPVAGMEEEFYYLAVRAIRDEIASGVKRNVTTLDIPKMLTADYDNRIYYAVRSITYDISFCAEGNISMDGKNMPYRDYRSARFIFINDSRMGWLLSECIDDGEAA